MQRWETTAPGRLHGERLAVPWRRTGQSGLTEPEIGLLEEAWRDVKDSWWERKWGWWLLVAGDVSVRGRVVRVECEGG